MNRLGGMHDREGRHVVPADGWCLDLIALSENPASTDYTTLKADINWIVRAGWGYGSTGTIPLPVQYEEMARRLAAYVQRSAGCSRWIIGNEPNLAREWPQGQPIHPIMYAECYLDCRHAIHATPGHERDEVLVAAPGPWNAEFKYPGNELGDWIAYFEDVQDILGNEWDGFALHAYTHGCDPALVTSEARMGAPFAHRRYEFRVYQDYLAAVRPELRDRPVYITEANGNEPWQAVGLIPAMLQEISEYNASVPNGIQSVIFYRYPGYDANAEFAMGDKPAVIAEFVAAMQRDYIVSGPQSQVQAGPSRQYIPVVSTGPTAATPSAPALPPRAWDSRLDARGVKVITPSDADPGGSALGNVAPGQHFWRAVNVAWLDEQQAQGRHHIYGNVRKDGVLIAGVPLTVTWPDDSTTVYTEDKSQDYPPFNYWYNYQLSPSLHEFSVQVADGTPSEVVTGIGMGADGNSHLHTCTVVEWALVTMPMAQPTQPPVIQPQPQATMPLLAHPVGDPARRIVTQPFGVNEGYYKQYSINGVALLGHEGIDFGTPVGTPIVAVDGGTAVEVADQGDSGYGRYIKLAHAWGESVYAHLSRQHALVGEGVNKGQLIGYSGNTGNSTGPHLHFGLRVKPFNRQDGWGGFTNPAPFLPNTVTVTPQPAAAGTLDPLVLEAIVEVEAAGKGYVNGRLKIRLEGHLLTGAAYGNPAVFDRFFRRDEDNRLLEYFRHAESEPWTMYHADQNKEWAAFEFARSLDEQAALRCTSMGAGQIMGFNAARVGYGSPAAMLAAFQRSETAQLVAVVNFCLSDAALVAAIRAKNWNRIAKRYNGAVDVYAPRLQGAYARLNAAT